MNRPTDEGGNIQAKVEAGDIKNKDKASNSIGLGAPWSTSTSSTPRQRSGFKNPRIVRVSRMFGGKDRHSKVCTVRGLRDRRIRLSVPTAIQLYDIQERLGLSQPSKVIDWLLDATKLDIDELPPLQFPPGGDFALQQSLIGHHHHQFITPFPYLDSNLSLMRYGPTHSSSSSMMFSGKINDNLDDDHEGSLVEASLEKIKWNNRSDGQQEQDQDQVSAQTFFPMGGGDFVPSMMHSSSSVLPCSNVNHWDPSSLSLSQFGSHGSLVPSDQEPNPGSSSPSTNHQMFFCPPMSATTSFFP